MERFRWDKAIFSLTVSVFSCWIRKHHPCTDVITVSFACRVKNTSISRLWLSFWSSPHYPVPDFISDGSPAHVCTLPDATSDQPVIKRKCLMKYQLAVIWFVFTLQHERWIKEAFNLTASNGWWKSKEPQQQLETTLLKQSDRVVPWYWRSCATEAECRKSTHCDDKKKTRWGGMQFWHSNWIIGNNCK